MKNEQAARVIITCSSILTQLSRLSLLFHRCYGSGYPRRVTLIGISDIHDVTDYNCEATGTSSKSANTTERALGEFENEHSVKLEEITKISSEGDGTIKRCVEWYVLY